CSSAFFILPFLRFFCCFYFLFGPFIFFCSHFVSFVPLHYPSLFSFFFHSHFVFFAPLHYFYFFIPFCSIS
ncbi:hypothetical protein GLOIN_2v1648629, partial [Rhizophagus irregularis DAOM 181602=DAOM 197198]